MISARRATSISPETSAYRPKRSRNWGLSPQRRAPEEDQGGQKNRAEANAYHRGVDHPQCAAQQGDQGEKAGKHAQAQIETDLPMPD